MSDWYRVVVKTPSGLTISKEVWAHGKASAVEEVVYEIKRLLLDSTALLLADVVVEKTPNVKVEEAKTDE